MNDETTADGIRAELEKVKGFFEVAQLVAEFHCYRHFDPSPQSVTVKVFDYGPAANPEIRYYCHATTPDGRLATGNPDKSVKFAMFGVHWENLDKPPLRPVKESRK
jgi:hypothetical protein